MAAYHTANPPNEIIKYPDLVNLLIACGTLPIATVNITIELQFYALHREPNA